MKESFDFVVIGSGPGGQKAAVCAAKAGRKVALIEQDSKLGGACVHHGTIPSKALREVAVQAERSRQRDSDGPPELEETDITTLLGRVGDIVSSYADTVEAQMLRNEITVIHGRASFLGPHEIQIRRRAGDALEVSADFVIVAAGSRPRHPDEVSVDHEHILDADSILKLAYLPRSLAVLGGGVIACEYASVLARLGVQVTIIDRGTQPLGFLDSELVDYFLHDFEAAGGRYLGGRTLEHVGFDGVSQVALRLSGDEVVSAEKVFVALGRSGCLEALDLEAAGLSATARGTLEVGDSGATTVPHIYAVGDVAGPPALATSAMEQGRRAVRNALGLPTGRFAELIPTGIYAIPEIASVGAREEEVRDAIGDVAVGRARFEELARGQISHLGRGLLKLVVHPGDGRILGAHAVGQGASELVHVAQMAIIAGACADDLIENIFNFPTLTEAYRVAALDVSARLDAAEDKPA